MIVLGGEERMAISRVFEWSRTDWSVKDIQVGLAGSPYSIPELTESSDRVQALLTNIQTITSSAVVARQDLVRNLKGLGKDLRRVHRVTEIHESNRVEGLGPELLAHTHEILSSKSAADIENELGRFAIIEALRTDQRTRDVLQLHGAKLLADIIMRDSNRQLVEIDVRNMHHMLMGDFRTAGRYKVYCNEIAGAEHVPFTPSDTPAAMQELMDWYGNVREQCLLPPVVAAAAVHAWLAHIHPFEDGNGRVARLMANIIIGSAGLPPLIIRVAGDRNRYLNALAISDQGGDLAPLAGVFLRTLRRAIRDMRNPRWALRIFEEEIRQRAESSYNKWRRSFQRWLELLGGALALHRLAIRTDPEEMISRDGYARIRQRVREGLVVGGIGSSDWYPGSRSYLLLDPADELFRYSRGEPTLSFLVYAPQPWGETVYARMRGRIREILVREDLSEGVVIRELDRTRSLPALEAAEYVAERIALDFRDGLAQARVSIGQRHPSSGYRSPINGW
ncbi:Fic family protein [Nonomuraea sp. NPDC050547]|uniref:Fic family protein n=1 Tax=Nonomuraea sp. NPDC050547 TaxID=3364368 RepID=UPI0037AB9BD3